LGYDTIYGAQDISDDEIIGLKSTSIKFKKNINQFVASMYLISMFLICYLFKNEIGCNFFTLLLGLFLFTLIFQVFMFDKNKKESCLKMFKTNNLSGLILFLSILTLND
jgi:4-hydroxybenzoate polyprenyltransferase